MSRRRSGRSAKGPKQLPLPAPKTRLRPTPEQTAKNYIAKRGKPSVVPGHVKLTFTLDLKQALAERLSVHAIREHKNLEAVMIELLDDACP
jgi:hypothetical protein